MSFVFVTRRKPFALPVNHSCKQGFFRGRLQRMACAVAISFFFFAPCASAQSTYRDPSGNFSVDVPSGWHSEKNPQSSQVTVSKGSVSVSFDVATSQDGSTPPPKSVLDGMEKQLMKDCPQAEVLRRGDTNLAGQAGVFLQVSCSDSKRGTALMTVSVATRYGQILVCNSSSFSSEYAGVKPVVDGIVRSFRLGVGDPGTASTEGPSQGSSNEPSTQEGSDAAKLRALEDACASGVLSPDECAAKRAALAGKANSSENDRKLQALQKACQAGVFTPEECAAKLAALKSAAAPQGSTGSATTASGGTVYSEPHGAFRLEIPQGWEASSKSGCYGPSDSCPPGAGGVNIAQGSNWAFVAPFSADARQPTDVVNVVAGQYQSQYKNLKMIQNEPQKFGNLDIALGQFTAVDSRGITVSLVVIGIAAPNHIFYVACSSVDPNDAPTAGPALTSMLQSLQFAGQ